MHGFCSAFDLSSDVDLVSSRLAVADDAVEI
jgi:hypothetical protein